MIYILFLVVGVVAGLRALTPFAAISIGAWLGWIDLGGTWAGFLATPLAAIILVILAILELVGDQLPTARSRKEPVSFVGRTISGALSGVLLGLPTGNWIAGLILGAIGAVIGTLGGFEARRRLAQQFGRDRPAAFIEDAVAIILAFGAVWLA
ncbi:MAG: putative rane protein [Devosia sp.]|uniref:DUF4126 family protein n=1 Tax=Devosia sp. TaxID=1871048 RepID=UPI00262723A1|nr:DUF4126 family protein [Devosia sp.]MDB5540493.1 putative rane protein [Devosia sp.]